MKKGFSEEAVLAYQGKLDILSFVVFILKISLLSLTGHLINVIYLFLSNIFYCTKCLVSVYQNDNTALLKHIYNCFFSYCCQFLISFTHDYYDLFIRSVIIGLCNHNCEYTMKWNILYEMPIIMNIIRLLCLFGFWKTFIFRSPRQTFSDNIMKLFYSRSQTITISQFQNN